MASSSENVAANMASKVERTFEVQASFDAALLSFGSTSPLLLGIIRGVWSM